MDSASTKKMEKIQKADSIKIKKAEQITRMMDEYDQKKQMLEQLRQMDSLDANATLDKLNDPQFVKAQLNDKYGNSKLANTLMSVQKFQIGVAYPTYSDFTLNGVPVKGIDLHLANGKKFYGFTVGRSTMDNFSSFTTTRPDFKRNTMAMRYGVGDESKSHIVFEALHMKDMLSSLPETYSPKQNTVYTVGGQYVFKEIVRVKGAIARSKYKTDIHQGESIVMLDSQIISNPDKFPEDHQLANSAFDLEAEVTPTKTTTIEASYKRINPAFKSLGNPFMRTNIREYEINAEQKFWKNRIRTSVFYKNNQDNVMETNRTTNNMKGYGFKLETKFKKYPNLFVMHSPYQQGNNHPDSFLRTQNNFSLTTATVTYSKRFKRNHFVNSD